MSQLSRELSESFGNVLAPLVKELAGSKPAWEALTVSEVHELLASAIGASEAAKYTIEPGDLLMKLVSIRTCDWYPY